MISSFLDTPQTIANTTKLHLRYLEETVVNALLYIRTLILKDLNYVSALDEREEFGFLSKHND